LVLLVLVSITLLANHHTADVAIVEISITAHTINQLACINIPAINVSVIVFWIFFSLPLINHMISRSINAKSPKLAKFFVMFQICRRY